VGKIRTFLLRETYWWNTARDDTYVLVLPYRVKKSRESDCQRLLFPSYTRKVKFLLREENSEPVFPLGNFSDCSGEFGEPCGLSDTPSWRVVLVSEGILVSSLSDVKRIEIIAGRGVYSLVCEH